MTLPEPSAPAPAKPVGAVVAALEILRSIGRAGEPMRLSDIVRASGLNGSTALNILRTLEQEQLVSFDRRTKRYALDHGLTALAAPLAGRDNGQRLADAMAAAAHELGVTVALWQVAGEDVELLAVAEAPSTMHISFMVGRHLPLFLGAIGRLVAGRMTLAPAEMRRLFDKVAWTHAPDFDAWLADVATARSIGWAIDRGNVNHGVIGIAVPVDGNDTRLVSAALLGDLDDVGVHRVVGRLRQVARLA